MVSIFSTDLFERTIESEMSAFTVNVSKQAHVEVCSTKEKLFRDFAGHESPRILKDYMGDVLGSVLRESS